MYLYKAMKIVHNMKGEYTYLYSPSGKFFAG